MGVCVYLYQYKVSVTLRVLFHKSMKRHLDTHLHVSTILLLIQLPTLKAGPLPAYGDIVKMEIHTLQLTDLHTIRRKGHIVCYSLRKR